VSARYLARSVHGLEWIAADEITRLLPAARDITLARREVSFALPDVDAALLDLRTVDDVFQHLGTLTDVGATKAALPDLARRVANLPVPARSRRFDVVASLEGRRTYNRFAVEDTIGSALAPVVHGEYVQHGPDAGPTDLSVRVFLRGTKALVAARVGAAPLHRRAYKQATGPGTLHPPVAAALAALVTQPDSVFDPFCGDGTIAIEAALRYPQTQVSGTDIDPARIANARANAERAGVGVSFAVADAGSSTGTAATTLVTNPPWNLAVDARGDLLGSLDRFWDRLPDRACLLADESLQVPQTLARRGFSVSLSTRIRLAGRVSHVVLAGDPVPESLAAWRRRAITAGVSTETGF
jgi:tRNA (guanine6-N2)-methyltransferase